MRTKRVLGIILTPPRYVLWGFLDWTSCQTFNYNAGPRLAFLGFFAAVATAIAIALFLTGWRPPTPW